MEISFKTFFNLGKVYVKSTENLHSFFGKINIGKKFI